MFWRAHWFWVVLTLKKPDAHTPAICVCVCLCVQTYLWLTYFLQFFQYSNPKCLIKPHPPWSNHYAKVLFLSFPLLCLWNDNRTWEYLAPWQGSKVTVPTKFIVGDKDIGFETVGTKEYVEGDVFKSLVPDLEVVILDGHHFLHEEKAQQVSHEILSFLSKFSRD